MADREVIKLFKLIPLWSLILLVGLMFYYTASIRITSDMGWYMNTALNLYNGNGYTDIDGSLILLRSAGFPAMIAIGYWILGVSAWSAVWVIRLFCILNPLAIYFLGKRLFGKWVGFAAAILLLSSYSYNYWSYRHIDVVWPFFALLFLLYIYIGFERYYWKYFVLAGFLIALSYHIKQSAILLVPLPIFLLIHEGFRAKKNFIAILFYLFVVTICISYWIYYVYLHSGNFAFAVLGAGANKISGDMNLGYKILNYFTGIIQYYTTGLNSLSNNFIIAPLFPIGWFYIIYLAVKKQKEAFFLMVCFLLLSPYISVVGKGDLRVGQLLIFILLSYLAAAKLCLDISKHLVSKFKKDFPPYVISHNIPAVGIISALCLLQTFVAFKADRGNKIFLKNSYIWQKLLCDFSEFEIKGNKFSEITQSAGVWIKNNIQAGKRFVVSKPSEGKGIYFYSGGLYPIHVMPITQSNKDYAREEMRDNRLIFLSAWADYDTPQNKIYALSENGLLKQIKEQGIDYIIVNKRRNYLSEYCRQNSGIALTKEFGNGTIKIYKVLKAKPAEEFKTMVSDYLISYLNELKSKNSDKLTWYYLQFFNRYFYWSEERFERLVLLNSHDGQRQEFNKVENFKIY